MNNLFIVKKEGLIIVQKLPYSSEFYQHESLFLQEWNQILKNTNFILNYKLSSSMF